MANLQIPNLSPKLLTGAAGPPPQPTRANSGTQPSTPWSCVFLCVSRLKTTHPSAGNASRAWL